MSSSSERLIFCDVLEGDLTCQVDLVANRVAMLANRRYGLVEHLGLVGS